MSKSIDEAKACSVCGTALSGVQVGKMERRAGRAARPLTDRYGLRDRHAALRSWR